MGKKFKVDRLLSDYGDEINKMGNEIKNGAPILRLPDDMKEKSCANSVSLGPRSGGLSILQGRKSTKPQAAYDSAPPRLKTAADGERYARQWLARRGMA